jgi:hypothetical protein
MNNPLHQIDPELLDCFRQAAEDRKAKAEAQGKIYIDGCLPDRTEAAAIFDGLDGKGWHHAQNVRAQQLAEEQYELEHADDLVDCGEAEF